ncbi:NAD(P)-binding domain containing protein [Trema orientale]|uniref:NAD(P)-binding domain containing protein n=1 Tax=Trema orientale TaxID=63057 RepID=A0A2P5FDS6_TREOI|nr:NAD(P)-binding domain containing protein [Trema orientale]
MSKLQANLVDPCIKGTLNVLSSCSKASSVKRIVLTSSCSSIRYRYDVQQVSPLNESHWSDPEYCKHYNLLYAYAKTTAEKEAWKFAEETRKDLVVVNPSFVVGPLLAPQPTSTLLLILAIIRGARGEYPNTTVGFVHIDDVVAAHILAMEDSRASGRLVCSSSVAHWSQIIEMLRAKYPSYPFENKCSSQVGDSNPHSMDTTKISQLGFPSFKTLDQMFDDCIKSFQEKGFL